MQDNLEVTDNERNGAYDIGLGAMLSDGISLIICDDLNDRYAMLHKKEWQNE